TCSELLSRQRRTWIIDTFSIEEGHPGPFPYVLGKVSKPLNEENYQSSKSLTNAHFHPKIFEAKRTDLSLDTKLGVEISILDINDNPPSFQRDLYEISIGEERAQAHDRDKAGTPNSTFHYEIKSMSPNPPDAEFFINDLGVISFKGCLDYEVGETYTVVVEAKDHGEVVSLSSSTTILIHVQDGNNHLPSISGQTAGFSLVRLHVTDGDSPNTAAWRAKYFIHGDEGGHFKIETDPETNDGILTVVKPLDFEEGAERELSISVENEVPYFSCKPQFVNLIIQVEDTNDPPVFKVTVKEAKLEENAPIGTWVETVTAVDPDTALNTSFVYMIGDDPDGWVTVDPETGRITTVKPPDRESPNVVNGVYTVIVHAVDNGNPPMTGTATMLIHVKDQNDNVPQLTVDHVDMCVSEGASTTSITAFDPDDEPFTGPFRFELLGEAKGKWRLNTSYDLMKEPSVYAGPHTVELKISDMQSQFAFYNLSVTVCDCSVTPNCRSDRAIVTKMGFGAMGIVFATLFILLCKKLIHCLYWGEAMQQTQHSTKVGIDMFSG
uniref:Cadherin 27 n=1 Tax=Myripristis murdjan TaxID=586833 RepID=A0A667ZI92_9TELE